MYPRAFVRFPQNWLDARERVGDNLLRDFNGMPYLVPMGMVSTQVRVHHEESRVLICMDTIDVPGAVLPYLAFRRVVRLGSDTGRAREVFRPSMCKFEYQDDFSECG